jgi:hypothetical protein
MQMIQCPNCGKLTGFKRALGFGTFFMVLLTCGLWLLVIPFYPARCINCGLTRGSAVTHNFRVWFWSLNWASRICVVLAPFVLLFGIGVFNALRNASQPNPPTTFTANNALVSNAENDLPPAAPVTYTVAQISAHMNNIPTGTDLAARGFYLSPHVSGGWAPPNQMDPCSVLLYGGTVRIQHGEADPRDYCRFSVLLQDENTNQILVCNMSLEEAQAAKRQYSYKSVVLAHGTYASSLDFNIMPAFMGQQIGVPALDDCTLEPLSEPPAAQ